jgi:hypothetical protein
MITNNDMAIIAIVIITEELSFITQFAALLFYSLLFNRKILRRRIQIFLSGGNCKSAAAL